MAEITATLVKNLREKTGAGMMDCKNALSAVEGDMEAAIDWLRAKGLAAASKKSGRATCEGAVAIAVQPDFKKAVVVELNSETDFVAKNENFQRLVQRIAEIALAGHYTVDTLLDAAYDDTQSVREELTRLIATIGENMQLRRLDYLSVENGIVATYIHGVQASQGPLLGMGRIGVAVALSSEGAPQNAEKLAAFGKQLAMHAAAAFPKFLNIQDVDADDLNRERAIFTEQAQQKPGVTAEVIEKMVEGRIRKYYEEVVLSEQMSVIREKEKVKDGVALMSKECGTPVTLTGFIRFQLGEGAATEESESSQ